MVKCRITESSSRWFHWSQGTGAREAAVQGRRERGREKERGEGNKGDIEKGKRREKGGKPPPWAGNTVRQPRPLTGRSRARLADLDTPDGLRESGFPVSRAVQSLSVPPRLARN